jgi:hypothetical protein
MIPCYFLTFLLPDPDPVQQYVTVDYNLFSFRRGRKGELNGFFILLLFSINP